MTRYLIEGVDAHGQPMNYIADGDILEVGAVGELYVREVGGDEHVTIFAPGTWFVTGDVADDYQHPEDTIASVTDLNGGNDDG